MITITETVASISALIALLSLSLFLYYVVKPKIIDFLTTANENDYINTIVYFGILGVIAISILSYSEWYFIEKQQNGARIVIDLFKSLISDFVVAAFLVYLVKYHKEKPDDD